MRPLYLKVKIKTLAAEARIIRSEENWQKTFADRCRVKRRAATTFGNDADYTKWDGFNNDHANTLQQLHSHRVVVVRKESRASQLAYAFLRGKPYAKVETPTEPLVVLKSNFISVENQELLGRVRDIVISFGGFPTGLTDKDDQIMRLATWTIAPTGG